jgi:DNA-directed RNA polymerase subunit K/omega
MKAGGTFRRLSTLLVFSSTLLTAMEDFDAPGEQPADATPEPLPHVDPPDSRFLFVDIAAMRAKQLRRGALPRLHRLAGDGSQREMPHKLERIAMEEVRQGIIAYDLPVTLAAGREREKEA